MENISRKKSSLFQFSVLKYKILLFILSVSFFALHILGRKNLVIIDGFTFVLFYLLFYLLYNDIPVIYFSPISLLICIALEILQFASFLRIWSLSGIVQRIANICYMNSSTFLWIIGGLCVFLSFPGLYILVVNVTKKHFSNLIIITICLLSFLQIQISSGLQYNELLSQRFVNIIINILVIYLIYLTFYFLICKRSISLILTSLLITIISVINHFVILYHGSPLFPSELTNVGTALNVVSGYTLKIDHTIIAIIVVFLIQLLLILYYITNKGANSELSFRKKAIYTLVLIERTILTVILLLCIINHIDPANFWNWRNAILNNGYLYCCIINYENLVHPIKEVEGYDVKKLNYYLELSPDNNSKDLPDIFLILNETFCDLGEYCSLDSDIDYLKDFYGIPGTSYGYSCSSLIGGGTNNSEFELLTSNSMNLLRASAPFTYLDLKGLDASVVSYFNALGYNTTAMHCQNSRNYSRNKAFPALGFDTTILGTENFTFHAYGNRNCLDMDNYTDMLTLYRHTLENDGRPQFYYMLTYQNHGSYEQNDDTFDLVHIKNDYGGLTDNINEFLTSIYMSAEALKNLINELNTYDRKIIVCMVGDHAPAFISQLPPKNGLSSQEIEIALRKVPFMMWSNYGIDFQNDYEYASMTDLIPILLKSADFQMTPYYEEINRLHNIIPLRLNTGLYLDASGNFGEYKMSDKNYEKMSIYFYMEYNALKRGNDYKESLFMLN